MPVLGIPDASGGFSIGTSSSIAQSSGAGVDMSLDDMIKSRRSVRASVKKEVETKRAVRKASAGDKAVARGHAKRTAASNARRGIAESSKPTTMQIDREVYRQSRKAAANKTPVKADPPTVVGRKSRRVSDQKAKLAKKQKEQQQKKKELQKKKESEASGVPAWIGGTRRPPSKKAVNAAVAAMTDAGFKVPKGMQMVISFAPAPESDPTKIPTPKKKTGDSKKTSGRGGGGGGRGGGRGRGRGRR